MMEEEQLHPDWCLWRPAAPGMILSPLPGASLSLASVKGHRYTILCPCPTPTYLIQGQDWPHRACQGPPFCGPRAPDLGAHTDSCFFEALGRLIGLLHRAPLWGSAQACSSCWVCRRRKEQRLIPLQVSLSVATLHFQWLGKVTSAPAKLAQESHKQHQLEKYRKRCWGFLCRENGRFFFKSVSICAVILTQSPILHVSLDDPGATAEQPNTSPRNAVYRQFSLDYGLMVKWMTTNMQMYISYLHSRFQTGVANHKQIRGSPLSVAGSAAALSF